MAQKDLCHQLAEIVSSMSIYWSGANDDAAMVEIHLPLYKVPQLYEALMTYDLTRTYFYNKKQKER